MGIIYLVRHGQCLDNAQHILNGKRDTALTELGKEQAKIAGLQLKDAAIKKMFSSPLKRAHDTALIIAEVLGIKEVAIEPDLIERDYGNLSGKNVADIPKIATKIFKTPMFDYILEGDEIETFPETYRRAVIVLNKLKKEAQDGNIVAVAHGDIGMMIQAVFYGWSWEDGLRAPYWHNGELMILKTTNTN